jgi:phage-related tail fiber protein
MSYLVKLTAVGAAKIAAAEALTGPQLQLTEMAVGDGNGNPVPAPTGVETALVREVYRDQLESLLVSDSDPTVMIAEMLIPSEVGGWAVRELGIFDTDGDLIAYGNFPDTYKPIASEGSTREMVVRVAIKVTNSDVVTLVIDATVVGATRAWVLSTITPAFLFPGGTTGQVLTKQSNADGDTYWSDPTAALNIVVDVVKEEQTAAAAQSTFTLTVCTTDGVAVYVEGVRVHNFTVLSDTQVQLPSGLAADTKVLFVQNEPNEPLHLRRMAAGKAYFMGQFT